MSDDTIKSRRSFLKGAVASAAALGAAPALGPNVYVLPPKRGSDGADGLGYEMIYGADESSALPESQWPDDSWALDTPGSRNGMTWTDAAFGFEADRPLTLFEARRVIAPDGAPLGPWTAPRPIGRVLPNKAIISVVRYV